MGDKVMHPPSPPKGKGIKHTGTGKLEGPKSTQLNPHKKKG